MKMPKLTAYRVSDLSFINHLESGSQLKLAFKSSYNVRYPQGESCIAELIVEGTDRENDGKFLIRASLTGVFQYDLEQPREVTHVQTYEALFPYMRALITTITANAGIPPIFLPPCDPSSQTTYRIDRNPK